MNARRMVLPARTRFPLVLIAIALALGSAGWRILVAGTPTAPELENQGYIGVYLSDPEADVSFSISPTRPHSDEGEELPGYRWLFIDLTVESREDPVWWAVALGGSARFPPGNPVSGEAPGIEPFNEERAYFVNNVVWPEDSGYGNPKGHGTGTVVFGYRSNKPEIPAGIPRRKLNAGLAGGRLPRSGVVRISSYFRTL